MSSGHCCQLLTISHNYHPKMIILSENESLNITISTLYSEFMNSKHSKIFVSKDFYTNI